MKSSLIRLLGLVLAVGFPASLSSLTVTLDDNYPPYSFRDSQGKLQGISVDSWALWSQKTGTPVDLVGRPWSEALDLMGRGKADVIDTVFLTPERASRWLFTGPYVTIKTAVFHREGLIGIVKPSDLKGYLVGVKSGDAGADALRAEGIANVIEYPDYGSIIDAAGRGEILVFCMDVPPAVHFLFSRGLGTQFRQAFVLSQDSFHRAVPRDRPELLLLLDRGFTQFSTGEIEEIDRRWMGSPLGASASTVAFAILAALAIITVLVGVVVSLRRQVKRRTGQLAGTEEKLKLSEDRAQALIAALPDLLFIINQEGRITETLGAGQEPLDQSSERFVGQSLAQVLGPEAQAEVMTKMTGLSDAGRVATVEASMDVRGEARTFEARIVRLSDGRFLSILRDVSDSRRAWQNDLHRNKLESLGLLAGGLAHDFNNSLAVIQGFVSLARVQLPQPEKALASLDKAVQATRKAAGLTSQLRVLAHGGEVHRTLLSVKTLAEEAAAFALVGSPCLLSVDAGSGPWGVEADPDQLSQVFHNLVLNAVQAMPGGGQVTLVFRRPSDERIVVSVVDEGAGIPSDHLKRIFDPYFTTKSNGTGLGLSVVHAVVERHGGTLEVDSLEGRGSVFSVSLPAAGEEPGLHPAPAPVPPEKWTGRVLVMEDEPDLRTLLGEVCSSLGFDQTLTKNGTEALAAFDEATAQGRPFDLVVSDLLVPGEMGGMELISLLRTRPGRFRALAVTGFSADQPPQTEGAGFDIIIGKPFTVDELKTRMIELLKSPWKTATNS